MAKKDINAEIQLRIEAFAEELSGLVREAAIEAVHEALATGTAIQSGRKSSRAAKGKTPARRSRGGKRVRRSEAQIEALGKKVQAHVKAHPGDRLEQIGVALNIPTSELKRPVANLLEAKALRTTGQRRGTKYHPGRSAGAAKKRKSA